MFEPPLTSIFPDQRLLVNLLRSPIDLDRRVDCRAKSVSRSDGSKRLSRGQSCRSHRRVEAGDGTDAERGDHAAVEGHGRDLHGPLLGRRVDNGGCLPMMVPASPPMSRQEERFSQELLGDVSAGGTERRRRPISERRSRTEMTMTLAMPTPPTRSATAPSPRNSPL